MADSLVKDHNLSLMAVDRATNSPVAVMLNGVFQRSEIDVQPSEVSVLHQSLRFLITLYSQVVASCTDPKFAPVASILHEVQRRARETFYNNNIETVFDLKVRVKYSLTTTF